MVEDVKDFPRNRIAFIITDQIVRSVSSISSNIAEATGTPTGKDFEHFLIIARRETGESENWYIKVKKS